MNMNEGNKYDSFFSAGESPIPVPPSEEAWSQMKGKLDVLMPVTPVRVLRPKIYRWGVPAATVAVITVGVWVGLIKGGQRHAGRAAARVVSRGVAAKPVDSLRMGDARLGDVTAPVDAGGSVAAAPVDGGGSREVAVPADSRAAGSGKGAGGKLAGREMKTRAGMDSVARRGGADGDRAAVVKAGGGGKGAQKSGSDG